MTAFSTTGGTSHSTAISGLQNDNSYTYYIKCQDTAGNANTDDYPISFSVGSQVQPSGTCQPSLVLLQHYDNDLSDSSGNGNAGILANGAAYTAGRFSQALQFDGVDDYVNVSKQAGLYFGTNDFSVSLWIRTLTATADVMGDVNTYSSANRGWMFRLSTGKARVWMTDGAGTGISITGSASVNSGSWRHVTLVFDRDANLTIYVDGAPDKSASITSEAGTIDQCANIVIGAGRNNGTSSCGTAVLSSPLNGAIDEVSIWSRALSAPEVQALYTSGPVGCFHKSDTDSSGCVDEAELLTFIGRWKLNSSNPTLKELMEAIGLWKKGC
jgi:hypothetical protein